MSTSYLPHDNCGSKYCIRCKAKLIIKLSGIQREKVILKAEERIRQMMKKEGVPFAHKGKPGTPCPHYISTLVRVAGKLLLIYSDENCAKRQLSEYQYAKVRAAREYAVQVMAYPDQFGNSMIFACE